MALLAATGGISPAAIQSSPILARMTGGLFLVTFAASLGWRRRPGMHHTATSKRR
jgi:hypothetical protein